MDKILVTIYVASIDREFDLLLPISKNVSDILEYIQDSIVELLGFSEYTPPNIKSDAKNRAYFKGTINNLKRYMSQNKYRISDMRISFYQSID